MLELWRAVLERLRRRSFDRDLDEELAFHLDMKTQELGEPAAARRTLGSPLLVREHAREAWSWRWADDLRWDLRFAARMLRRHPGFTAIAVLTLALGLAINTTVFTVTNGVLFKGFPLVDPQNRILYVGSGKGEVSYPDFEDWRAQAVSFEDMAVVSHGGLRIRLSDQRGGPETCDGTQLSVNAFQVLGQRPIIGRDFAPSDGDPGAAPVTILSYGLWARRYGEDPAIVGQTVRLDNEAATVIGIMAKGFDFPHHRVDLWVPLRPTAPLLERQARVLWFAFGRLAEGVTMQSARREMDVIGHRLASAYPLTNQGILPVVMNFREFFIGPDAVAIYASLWGAVDCVLLIACANLANLFLGRAIGRSPEIAVRIALGAGRWRLVRQLLIESVMLSTVAGGVGWVMAIGCIRAYELWASPPGAYARWEYAMDARVIAYLAAVSIGTAFLFGLAPANRLSRLDLNETLKDGGRGATQRRGTELSAVLVIGEVALAVMLLAGAGVMVRSFLNLYTANLGVDASKLLTASVELPVARYSGAAAQMALFDRLMTRLAAIPGVESVALANRLPGFYAAHVPYEIAGAPPVERPHRQTIATVAVTAAYFRSVGAIVRSGRAFTDADGRSGLPVALVNQRLASAFWPGEEALGKRLRLFSDSTPAAWRTVIGVVSNIVQNDETGQAFEPLVYVPFGPDSSAGIVLARTLVPPGRLGPAVRREIEAIDPDLVIGSGYGSIEGPRTLSESLAFHYWSSGLNGALFVVFAAMALLLASLGVSAVVAHAVGRRTPEIGIRMMMGATAGDILALVLGQGLRPVGIGLALGLAAAVALTPLLKSQLVQVSSLDPLTLVVAFAAVMVSAALGCLIPARRATRVDPVVTLRHG